MNGVFSEVVKELMADADRAFSSGFLSHGISGVIARAITAAAGQTPRNVAGPAKRAMNNPNPLHPNSAPSAGAGGLGNVFSGRAASQIPNPNPLLEQILQILETIASLLHVQIRTTPGAPSGPDIRQRVRDMVTRGQWRNVVAPPAAPGGNSGPAPGAAGGASSGTAGGAGLALTLGRVAGAATLIVSAFALVYSAARAFVAGVLDQNRELAKYHGGLAASVANLDIKRINLDARQAAAVGPGGEELNRQFGLLLEEIQPIREAVGMVSTQFATFLVQLARVGANVFSLKNLIAAVLPGVGLQVAAAIEDAMNKRRDANAGALNNDLRALQRPGGINPIRPIPGVQPPQFLPPLVRPPGVDGRGQGGRR